MIRSIIQPSVVSYGSTISALAADAQWVLLTHFSVTETWNGRFRVCRCGPGSAGAPRPAKEWVLKALEDMESCFLQPNLVVWNSASGPNSVLQSLLVGCERNLGNPLMQRVECRTGTTR